ncbi:MAG: response regulator [bacterium]|nr:response regulator [bacterium]
MDWGYILCVNDNLPELNTLANQLQEEFSRSHIVYKAESAEEATLIVDMLQAAQKPIELILCDQMMPGVNGADFLDTIHQTSPEIMKILLLSPDDEMPSNYLLSRATVHEILEKPWKLEHLVLSVESLLRLYKLSRHIEVLQEISLQFGPIFDLRPLLKKAIQYIQEVTSAWKVAIAVTDGQSTTISAFLSSSSDEGDGSDEELYPKERLEALLKKFFSKRRELLIFSNAYENKYLQAFDIPGWYKANHILCMPLSRNENFFGAIYLADKTSGLPFFREDMMAVKILAYQLLSSLENIRLTEEKLRMERLSTIGNLAGEIIHDLKGPMTTILGFSELLEGGDCTHDEQQSYSGIIASEVDQMVQMVEEILEFSRGNKMKLALKPCDVKELIEDVKELLNRTFQEQGLQLATKLHCTRPIYADKEKLKRVFYNIANNAREALRENGRFSINTYLHKKKFIEFRLADSGAGIPDIVKENIFEPFVTYGKKRGTGLGMSVSKKIINDHGGEIWVESEEGKGTIFYFTVPLVRD